MYFRGVIHSVLLKTHYWLGWVSLCSKTHPILTHRIWYCHTNCSLYNIIALLSCFHQSNPSFFIVILKRKQKKEDGCFLLSSTAGSSLLLHTGSFVLNPALTSTGSNTREGGVEDGSWTQPSMSPLLVNLITVSPCFFILFLIFVCAYFLYLSFWTSCFLDSVCMVIKSTTWSMQT